jgi:hypothetical protein
MKDVGLEHAMLHTYDIWHFSAVKLTSEQKLKKITLSSDFMFCLISQDGVGGQGVYSPYTTLGGPQESQPNPTRKGSRFWALPSGPHAHDGPSFLLKQYNIVQTY